MSVVPVQGGLKDEKNDFNYICCSITCRMR